jgi:hypothetical protein
MVAQGKPVPARQVLEGVLWILITGAQWHMLPQCYLNHKTVHRRFQQCCRNDVLRDALCQLANTLRESEAIEESECFIEATFFPAKGGGDTIVVSSFVGNTTLRISSALYSSPQSAYCSSDFEIGSRQASGVLYGSITEARVWVTITYPICRPSKVCGRQCTGCTQTYRFWSLHYAPGYGSIYQVSVE